MKITELLEGYKRRHKCKTPDAIYKTKMKDNYVQIKVVLPKDIKLPDTKKSSIDLEADLHYAIEQVLARLFK